MVRVDTGGSKNLAGAQISQCFGLNASGNGCTGNNQSVHARVSRTVYNVTPVGVESFMS